ncbi:MAG: Rap1a/Tai family immunity protein [Vitreimonas sp.]
MRRSLTLYGAFLVGALLLFGSSLTARAATTEHFMVRTTSDLVALCETQPGQENYVAAIHFCEGYASGAYQYYLAIAHHSPTSRYVCPPDPPPSRDQAITGFVGWARANPSAMSEPAVESLFRYLSATHPCSDAQRAPSR